MHSSARQHVDIAAWCGGADPLGLEGNLDKFKRALKRVPGLVFAEAKKALQQSGQEFQREMKLTRFRRYTSWKNDKDILQSRTGLLNKSFNYEVQGGSIADLQVRVYSAGTSYANLQEYGGEIKPRNGKYLALPIGKALGPRGIPRKKGPREYPDGFFFTSKRGNLLFGVRSGRGKRKRIEPLYLLRTSVYVPPRLGFSSTWDRLGPNRVLRVGNAVKRGFNRAFEGIT